MKSNVKVFTLIIVFVAAVGVFGLVAYSSSTAGSNSGGSAAGGSCPMSKALNSEAAETTEVPKACCGSKAGCQGGCSVEKACQCGNEKCPKCLLKAEAKEGKVCPLTGQCGI